jgi:hypothetical protein
MIDFSSPLSGMTQAEMSVTHIATRLANPATDTVDLSTEMVSLMSARDSFARPDDAERVERTGVAISSLNAGSGPPGLLRVLRP